MNGYSRSAGPSVASMPAQATWTTRASSHCIQLSGSRSTRAAISPRNHHSGAAACGGPGSRGILCHCSSPCCHPVSGMAGGKGGKGQCPGRSWTKTWICRRYRESARASEASHQAGPSPGPAQATTFGGRASGVVLSAAGDSEAVVKSQAHGSWWGSGSLSYSRVNAIVGCFRAECQPFTQRQLPLGGCFSAIACRQLTSGPGMAKVDHLFRCVAGCRAVSSHPFRSRAP